MPLLQDIEDNPFVYAQLHASKGTEVICIWYTKSKQLIILKKKKLHPDNAIFFLFKTNAIEYTARPPKKKKLLF